MKTTSRFALTAMLIALPAVSARADVMDYKGTGLKASVHVYAPGYIAHDRTVHAGEQIVKYGGERLKGYCVDIDQWAGDTEVTAVPLTDSSLPNKDLVGFLFETYAPCVSSKAEAAGLGIAIWELLYESPSNPFDPASGDFRVTGNDAATTEAMDLIATLPAPGAYLPAAGTTVLMSPCKQDMLVGFQTVVPEPGTMLVLVAGSVGLLRRRPAER